MKIGTLLRLGLSDIASRSRALGDLYAGTGSDPGAALRPSYDEVVGQAHRLEAAGFDAVFTIESTHDVFFPLLLAAQATDLELMTNVAIALPRSPLHLAHQAYDLQLASRGRFTLGLGSQVKPVIERCFSAAWSRPVDRMREVVLAVKAIFAAWQDGARLDFRGEFFTHTFMNPGFNPGPNPYGLPPVFLAALGPRMTRMAAEVADGVLVHPFSSERFVRERVLPAVEEGLAATGRKRADFTLVSNVIVATGRDEVEMATAEAGVRALLAFYGSTPTYRPLLALEGYDELHVELHRLSREGGFADMAALIDDDVLECFAVRGEPDAVGRSVLARYGDVAGRVNVYLPYAAPTELLASVARGFTGGGP
ncbi:MAG: TIGR03617 family F420-dependent LLM class oxidoreductase [Acidimicrobiia bacterium]